MGLRKKSTMSSTQVVSADEKGTHGYMGVSRRTNRIQYGRGSGESQLSSSLLLVSVDQRGARGAGLRLVWRATETLAATVKTSGRGGGPGPASAATTGGGAGGVC